MICVRRIGIGATARGESVAAAVETKRAARTELRLKDIGFLDSEKGSRIRRADRTHDEMTERHRVDQRRINSESKMRGNRPGRRTAEDDAARNHQAHEQVSAPDTPAVRGSRAPRSRPPSTKVHDADIMQSVFGDALSTAPVLSGRPCRRDGPARPRARHARPRAPRHAPSASPRRQGPGMPSASTPPQTGRRPQHRAPRMRRSMRSADSHASRLSEPVDGEPIGALSLSAHTLELGDAHWSTSS